MRHLFLSASIRREHKFHANTDSRRAYGLPQKCQILAFKVFVIADIDQTCGSAGSGVRRGLPSQVESPRRSSSWRARRRTAEPGQLDDSVSKNQNGHFYYLADIANFEVNIPRFNT